MRYPFSKILFLLIAVIILYCAMTLDGYAYTKCTRDNDGNICCWDTDKDGTFPPLGC